MSQANALRQVTEGMDHGNGADGTRALCMWGAGCGL